jgi:hypothetical protein
MRTLAAAAVVAVGMMAAEPARALGEFQHQGWTGLALMKDGKFLQCQMWMSAINNWDVILSLGGDGELRLGVRNKDLDIGWRMLFDQRASARIQLDDGPVLIKSFKAVSPRQMSTSLNDTDWDKRLRSAEVLRVNTGRLYRFNLHGIKEAMRLLYACNAKHSKA